MNAIAPDITMTEGFMRRTPEELRPDIGNVIPMERPGDADEIASAAVYLASDMSSCITRQTIHVDDGTRAADG